jgi:hypothetical protein
MRNFRELASKLVPGRWVNVRIRVRKGLEETYKLGLEDAARVAEQHGMEVGDRIRQLGEKEAGAPAARPDNGTHAVQ